MPAFDGNLTSESQRRLTTDFCSFPPDTGRDASEIDLQITKDLLFIHNKLRKALHHTGFTSSFDLSQLPDIQCTLDQLQHSFTETHRSYLSALHNLKTMDERLKTLEGKIHRDTLTEGMERTFDSDPIITAESLSNISEEMHSAFVAMDEAFDKLCRPAFDAESRETDVDEFRKRLTHSSTLHFKRWSEFCQAQNLDINVVSREPRKNSEFDVGPLPISIV